MFLNEKKVEGECWKVTGERDVWPLFGDPELDKKAFNFSFSASKDVILCSFTSVPLYLKFRFI